MPRHSLGERPLGGVLQSDPGSQGSLLRVTERLSSPGRA